MAIGFGPAHEQLGSRGRRLKRAVVEAAGYICRSQSCRYYTEEKQKDTMVSGAEKEAGKQKGRCLTGQPCGGRGETRGPASVGERNQETEVISCTGDGRGEGRRRRVKVIEWVGEARRGGNSEWMEERDEGGATR